MTYSTPLAAAAARILPGMLIPTGSLQVLGPHALRRTDAENGFPEPGKGPKSRTCAGSPSCVTGPRECRESGGVIDASTGIPVRQPLTPVPLWQVRPRPTRNRASAVPVPGSGPRRPAGRRVPAVQEGGQVTALRSSQGRRAAVPGPDRTRGGEQCRHRIRRQRSVDETFTDLRLCAAVADRLTFDAAVIETGTDSYRLAHPGKSRCSGRLKRSFQLEGLLLERWRRSVSSMACSMR